jgi:hypothetical protein
VILLDTSVVSELMRPAPEPRLLQWLDAQPAADVWISAITVGEIRLGIALLPDGHRKERLAGLAEAMFQEDFSDNCLSYDVMGSPPGAKTRPVGATYDWTAVPSSPPAVP